MKKLIALIFILVSYSCNSKTPLRTIRFDKVTVKIPAMISEIKSQLNVEYQVYRGFRGKVDNYEILLHLENYPVWVNSKNVSEKFYANKKVIGITFISDDSTNLNSHLKTLSDKYSVTFKKDNINDYYIADKGLKILIFRKKVKCYVSFYNGVDMDRINDFYFGTW